MSFTLIAVLADVSMKKSPFSWAYVFASCTKPTPCTQINKIELTVTPIGYIKQARFYKQHKEVGSIAELYLIIA